MNLKSYLQRMNSSTSTSTKYFPNQKNKTKSVDMIIYGRINLFSQVFIGHCTNY